MPDNRLRLYSLRCRINSLPDSAQPALWLLYDVALDMDELESAILVAEG